MALHTMLKSTVSIATAKSSSNRVTPRRVVLFLYVLIVLPLIGGYRRKSQLNIHISRGTFGFDHDLSGFSITGFTVRGCTGADGVTSGVCCAVGLATIGADVARLGVASLLCIGVVSTVRGYLEIK